MDSRAIRSRFLEFFQEKQHLLISGASVIPRNDPTLLYVNSGMAPLKAYFVGAEQPPSQNLVNVQPCIRTNDIDDVGDRHHLTFFEMMGSWSIGGYFKEEAIALAFELLVDRFGLPVERLYASVFNGEGVDGVPFDEVSAAAWEKIGMAADHIVPLPAEDNFWGPAGLAGPCGPCTEVFLDTGDAFGDAYVPGGHFDTAGRYIEIWNAGVFMEFDKQLDGSFQKLPFTSVDTGSGLERMTLALNGLSDVYEGDGLAPIVAAAQATVGGGEVTRNHRIIADHLRASVMILTAGVEPSNEGRGYIPRRLLRRAFTAGLGLGHESLDLSAVVDAAADALVGAYPDVRDRLAVTHELVAAEAREFDATLKRGRDRLEQLAAGRDRLSGADVFDLYATYGLPIDITKELAAQRGIEVADDEIDAAAEQHRVASGAGQLAHSGFGAVPPAGVADLAPTEFVGYEFLQASSPVLGLYVDGVAVDEAAAPAEATVVVASTPFYPTGGGQVADVGTLTGLDHGAQATVGDVAKAPGGQILHHVTVTEGTLRVGEVVELDIADRRRRAIAANHSGTHLLNAALHRVLGDHVAQAGSLVEADKLRFDFTHPAPVTRDESAEIERLVNAWVLDDHPAVVEVLPYAKAIAAGARSLEGESYADDVRVIAFGEVSKELCGGTHVARTSQIGPFRITSEESVAAGVRRIYAVTGEGAVQRMLADAAVLRDAAKLLSTSPDKLLGALEQRLAAAAKAPAAAASIGGLREVDAGGRTVRVGMMTGEAKQMRNEATQLADRHGSPVLLWLSAKGRVSVAAASPTPDEISAAALVATVMAATGGKGGGGDKTAQGGFEPPDGADPDTLIATALSAG